MRARPLSLALIALGTAAVTAATVLPATAATAAGPSTTTNPYVLPVASGVDITSLLTVGDGAAANGYRMVGVPDGLGAYTDPDGSFVALMNQEYAPTRGIVRAHGQKGSFVSKYTIDPSTGKVLAGEDLIKTVSYYQYATGGYGSTVSSPAGATHSAAFNRFCSGTLSAPNTFLLTQAEERSSEKGNDHGKGKDRSRYVSGYDGQLYFANEEGGNEGRVFGVTTDGTAYQLPRLGLFSWENSVPAANQSATTVVMGDEDATPGELWVYAGTKQTSGSPVDKAGLTNGRNFVVKVPNATTNAGFRSTYGKGKPAPFSLNDVEWNQNGAKQNAEAVAEGGLGLTRIEDGHFNPRNKNEYFFVTTEGGDNTPAATGPRDGGGLWKLTFADVEKPDRGGTLELLLDGSESWGAGQPLLNKPDNVLIDNDGNLLIQEDPGGNDHLARILSYRLSDGARGVVARFDAELFGATNTAGTTPDTRAALTTDEEASGLIQLADGSYLFDAQIHTAKGLPTGSGPGTVEEYVERGQLLRMTVTDFARVYTVFS